MESPSADKIKQLKDAHPDRALHLVELQDPGDEEVHYLVMNGANADEYKIYNDALILAREEKTQLATAEKLRFVVKQAILRHTVWPSRDEVKAMLDAHPGFVMNLAEKVHQHAGTSAEVRSKKL